jgi:hypothetical protein
MARAWAYALSLGVHRRRPSLRPSAFQLRAPLAGDIPTEAEALRAETATILPKVSLLSPRPI